MYMTPVSVDQLVGKTLGQYHLQQLLGQGQVSAVYLAQQDKPKRPVMLTTFMLPEACKGGPRERFMARFSSMAAKLVQLHHPSLLPIDDFAEQLGYPYLVTPFVEEVSLATMLKQQGRCTPARTLELLKPIAAGLDYAHRHGIVHGTLKAPNVLLSGPQSVHITGLGFAHMLELRGIGTLDHPQSHLFSVAGTFLFSPEYIAPEVVQGSPADALSDIYALGILLFELLTGKVPFTGTNPLEVARKHVQQRIPALQEVCPDLPGGLDLVIQHALERDPAHRFQSATNLANAFERVLNVIDASARILISTEPHQIAGLMGSTLPPPPPLPTTMPLPSEKTVQLNSPVNQEATLQQDTPVQSFLQMALPDTPPVQALDQDRSDAWLVDGSGAARNAAAGKQQADIPRAVAIVRRAFLKMYGAVRHRLHGHS